jgi:hypothetical protein
VKRSGLPPRPSIRPPDPPEQATTDPKIGQLYVQAKALHNAGRFEEALKVYEQLASINPTDG